MAAWLADVHVHSAAVEAFWTKVETEAWLVASIDWIHKFPEVAGEKSECLILHATILLHAQTDLLNLAHIGAIMLAHIPDPYNAVISEVCLLAKRGSLLPLESAWHISKFVMITDMSFLFLFLPPYSLSFDPPPHLVLECSRTIHYVLRNSVMTRYSRLLYDLGDSI